MRKSRLLKEALNTNRMLNEQYEVLQKTYTDNAMLFHDMNNHLQTIYHMAENDGNAQIKEYVSRISSPIKEISNILWSGIGIVDAIINDKKKYAENKGYAFWFDVELPSNTGIATEDFCTILSNLLDNAIESLDRQSETSQNSSVENFKPQIKVSLRRINRFLMIQVSNPCTEIPKPQKGLFDSLKPDKFRHGWGLKSIKKSVAKYNGSFSCDILDGNFIATAILFFPSIPSVSEFPQN